MRGRGDDVGWHRVGDDGERDMRRPRRTFRQKYSYYSIRLSLVSSRVNLELGGGSNSVLPNGGSTGTGVATVCSTSKRVPTSHRGSSRNNASVCDKCLRVLVAVFIEFMNVAHE